MRLALPCLVLPALLAAPPPKLLKTRVPQGGVLVLTSTAKEPLQARLGDKRHPFFPAPTEGLQAVLVPVPLDSPLGARELTVEAEGAAPTPVAFTVTRTSAPTLTVKVAPSKAQPSAEDQARILRERDEFRAIAATPGPTRQWQEAFRHPGGGVITCGFGTTRRFNGEVQSIHKGLDLRAATGTPVFASAAGTVRLAKDVFFGGNLAYLDHGCGLFSVYAHLSRLDAKPGQGVRAGERLGLSGATGRVSAPHLHWGTSIHGVDVDPRLLQEATAALTGKPAPSAPTRKGRRR